MSPVLEMHGVSKSYGEGASLVQALREADLVVQAGELVAIMGPSGSGKSTMLTIAGTLEVATEGTVRIDGTDVAGLGPNDRARLRRRSVGYVFQDFNLLPGLTAAENVSLPLELGGTRRQAARAIALEALATLGMDGRAERFPEELSGGERQRVAIARAVVGDRTLLLADEPTGALDSVNGESVIRLVRNACHRGVAGVIVTHDAQLASWADRVVFLRDGRVVDQSTVPAGPDSLLTPSPAS
jgi:putative ABC transport system ATP-binding protein